MTDAALQQTEKRRHRPRTGMGVFVTDGELIEFLGVPEREARRAIERLDKNPTSGFPKKNPLWGDRRYLPAVKEWLDKTNRLGVQDVEKVDPRRRKRL